MPTITTERTIAASPQSVFSTSTQQDKITCRWSDEARVKPEVGSLGKFRFRHPAGVLRFEVTGLEP